MNSRERVLCALRGEEPDRVPCCETAIDRTLAQQIMGWDKPGRPVSGQDVDNYRYTVDEAKAIASFLGTDNVSCAIRAPVYAHTFVGQDGCLFHGEGMIRTDADLGLLQLPDPYDDALYAEAEEFVSQKEDYCAWFVTRIGILSAMLSMGTEGFCLALYDNPGLVERVLERYSDWALVVAERVCQMGFDVYVSTDDLAFKTGPFFSPAVFHQVMLPHFRRVAEKVTIPWIVHSDGNVVPLLEDLMSLGIAGLHPNEKGPMDIRQMKREYGDRLCLLGNVDLNILGQGTPDDVDEEVRDLIRDVGPGGGYIVTSGNSLPGYVRPENVLAMTRAVQRYGRYPLDCAQQA